MNFYPTVIESLQAGIWDWIDIHKEEKWWSNQFYALLGYQRGEIESNITVFKNLLHPKDCEVTFSTFQQHFKSRQSFMIEYRLKQKTGSYKWFLGTGKTLFDKNEQPMRMIGTIQPICVKKKTFVASEPKKPHKKVENAHVEESEHRFLRIFESAGFGIALIDLEGRPLIVNDTFSKIVGYTKTELIRMIFTDFTHPQDVNKSWQNYKNLINGKLNHYQIEKRYRRKDGKEVWVSLSVTLFRDHDGLPIYTINMVQDMTEFFETREKLKTKSHQLSLFIKYSPTAMAMFDHEMRYMAISERWIEMYGLAGRDIIREKISNIQPALATLMGCHSIWVKADVDLSIENQETQCYLHGKKKWLKWAIHPWYQNTGEVGGLIASTECITHRKEAEIRLNCLNEELIQFNYRVSHDLVAPMKTVRGLAHFVIEDLESKDIEGAKESAKKIIHQVYKLESLVKDILDLSRAEIEESIEKIDLASVCEDIKESLDYLIEESKIDVRYDFQDAPAFVSQKTRVRQILENLISNGIKYFSVDRENPYVALKSLKTEQGITIIVEDNGIGIPKEKQNRVFTMFFRGDSKRSFGSGLGTYLVKKHVRQLGGTITFRSGLSGTTFILELPVMK